MGGKNQKLEVHLAGGDNTHENSRAMVSKIVKTLNGYENVTIKSADILGTNRTGMRSIALDTMSGEIYTQFSGMQLDKGPNPQAIMNHHASTVMETLPLRPEYINGKSFVPEQIPAPAPASPAR